jgi:hypothetical protein
MLLFGPAGVMVGTVPLMVNVIGVVVSVMPLYIIVTDGHLLSAENGPPYLGKQYCSQVESADAAMELLSDKALLPPSRELTAHRTNGLIIARVLKLAGVFR